MNRWFSDAFKSDMILMIRVKIETSVFCVFCVVIVDGVVCCAVTTVYHSYSVGTELRGRTH